MSINNKNYAVLGLGRYGFAVAKELYDSGVHVLAVDVNPDIVNAASTFIPLCKCADITDEDVMQHLGIANMDVVIIAMASSLESSVLATALCKEAGVKTIIAKCADEMHQKILSKVGADITVFPEKESGMRLAKNILSSGFVDMIELSDEVSMVEVDIRAEWVGKSLIELNLRKKYGINVVAIKTKDTITTDIDPTAPFTENSKLIVIADTDRLLKLK